MVSISTITKLPILLGGGGSFMKDGYNGDANELVEAGVYCCWGETTNLPTSGSGGFLMVLSPLSDPNDHNIFVIQIYFDSYSTRATGEIYTRMRWASTNWEPWRYNHA